MKQTLSRNPPLPFPWLQDAAGHYPTAPLPPDICRNLYLTLNFLSRRTLSFLQFLYPDILPASLAPYPLWSSALFARFHSGSPGSFFFLSVWLFLCQPIQDQLVPFLVLKVYSFSGSLNTEENTRTPCTDFAAGFLLAHSHPNEQLRRRSYSAPAEASSLSKESSYTKPKLLRSEVSTEYV